MCQMNGVWVQKELDFKNLGHLADSVERATVHLGLVSSSPMLSVEITLKMMLKKIKIKNLLNIYFVASTRLMNFLCISGLLSEKKNHIDFKFY